MVVAVAFAAVAVALPSALSTIDEFRRGMNGIELVVASLRRGDTTITDDIATASAASFARAADALRSPWMAAARLVPGVRRHIKVAEAMARAGGAAARAGTVADDVLAAAPEGGWAMEEGTVDTEALLAAAGRQQGVVDALSVARAELEASPSTWIAGGLARGRAEALRRAERAEASALRAQAGLEAAHRLLGADGPRRYLVLVADTASARGTGGVWRHAFVLEADGGRLTLTDGGGVPSGFAAPLEAERIPEWFRRAYSGYRSLRSWEHLNLSADFPTVAEIARSAARAGAGETDGVVQVTPTGLAALLQLTGPIVVEEWPDAIGSDDLVDVALRPGPPAEDGSPTAPLLVPVARATLARVVSTEVQLDPGSIKELGAAIEGGHVAVHSADPDDATALVRLGISGAVARTAQASDVVGVVTSDAAGLRSDVALRRRLRYVATIDPNTRRVRGRLEVVFGNGAEGEARQLVVLARPPHDDAPTIEVGGRRVQPGREPEGELVAYHTEVVVPAGGETTLRAAFSLPRGLEGSGRTRSYRLHLFTQPLGDPPPIDVAIDPSRGWEVHGEPARQRTDRGDVVISVELRQPLLAWLADVFAFRPWRAIRGLF